jgi:hypothetical protein
MSHDVFISYSSKDKPIADAICANLESASVRCWIAPRDVAAGEDWPTAIANAIASSRIMVLVFSMNANSSDQISRELSVAADCKLVIIPFKIDDARPEPGKQYYLSRTHWLDAMNPPTKEQIQSLVLRVSKILTSVGGSISTPSPDSPMAIPAISKLAPRKRETQLHYLWIPGTLLLLGVIAWVVLTFVTHILPVPLVAHNVATATSTHSFAEMFYTPTPNPLFSPTPNTVVPVDMAGATLYDGPGENYPKIGAAVGFVEIIGQANGCSWFQVVSSSGRDTSWISADRVTFSGECSDLPVPQIPPLKSTSTPTPTYTATPPQGEQALAFAAPILAAIASRSPIFQDDLIEPNPLWSKGDSGYAMLGYVEFYDFVLEIDEWPDSSVGAESDIIFRQGGVDRYDLTIDRNGYLNIGHNDIVGGTLLLPKKVYSVQSLAEGNHLQIIAQGAWICIIANGIAIAVVTDPNPRVHGLLSLYVGNLSVQEMRLKWGNLKIWDISDLPAAP